MKQIAILLFLIFSQLAIGQTDGANDGAFLDPPYSPAEKLEPFDIRDFKETPEGPEFAPFLGKPKFEDLIRFQTEVKSQGARGTCSIFSATALLESMLKLRGFTNENEDLSEEWLQYLIMRNRTSEGSDSLWNFNAYLAHGYVSETTLPYLGETWETVQHSTLSKTRCGHLNGETLKKCLLGHRDPRLLPLDDAQLAKLDPELGRAKKEALENLQDAFQGKVFANTSIHSVMGAKALLDRGIPLTLSVDFYYGAWNHRGGEKHGLKRNLDHWENGVVGYPQPDSLDLIASQKDPAGHSVVVFAYDDNMTVDIPYQTTSGKTRTARYKGVYFIKNSWGTGSYGKSFKKDGVTYPGFGILVQKYAHDYGRFYHFELRSR